MEFADIHPPVSNHEGSPRGARATESSQMPLDMPLDTPAPPFGARTIRAICAPGPADDRRTSRTRPGSASSGRLGVDHGQGHHLGRPKPNLGLALAGAGSGG